MINDDKNDKSRYNFIEELLRISRDNLNKTTMQFME